MVNKIVADQPNGLDVSTSNDTWILEKGFTISDDDSEALFETSISTGNTFTIKGSVENLMGNAAADFDGTDTTVNISKGGVFAGGYAGATFDGTGASVVNDGKVTGGSIGFLFDAKGFDLVNNGSIEAGDQSIDIEEAGGRIVNGEDGVMSSDISAMLVDNHGFQRVTIVNQGEVHGANFSIYSTIGKEHIRNTGLLDGDISLGGGADVLDSRGGGIVGDIDLGGGNDRVDLRQRSMVPADPANEGLVLGGNGDDTFIIDDASIKIVEFKNGGNDTVKSSVSVTLSDYVETLQLIGKGDVNGIGNSGFNSLKGNAGDNHLNGKAGFDDLNGGRGNDVLTGGADGDSFVFATHGGHDRITDFDSVSDVVDLSAFDIGSFAELKKQHMQEVGDNLVISFGDDVLTLKDTHFADVVKADFVL